MLLTYYLVQDYLLYQVVVNVHVDLDANSPFPALTICHHHPFSEQAYRVWQAKNLTSPSQFNREMRRLAHNYLLQNSVEQAELSMLYDSINIYYQNLTTPDAIQLGHNLSIFLNCMVRIKQNMQIEDNCADIDELNIRNFSHHTYFNCHIFEPKTKEDAEGIDALALIISLGPQPDYKNAEQAFVSDLFDMARGLRWEYKVILYS